MRNLMTILFVATVAASAALSAFAADVPPPCAPVPVQKAVKVERREIAVSIIGKGLLSRAKCRSAEEMIAYWTAAMDEEIGNKPDLVVLPEICDVLQGVSPQEKADWLRRRGNRVLEAFAAYAKRHRCYIVYPTYRQLPDGAWANCAIVIDRDGDVVGVYDKYQPTVRDLGNPAMDVRPGTGTCVVETDFGRLGVMICSDLNFQPIQDLYAKENVDVLAFPSYYDGGHNRHTWAARCQAYVVAATVGSLDKTVVGPAGDELFRAVSPVTTATVRINTNCRVVHLDFNEAKLAAAKKKYGSRLAYRYEGRTGVVTVLSTDPALPVDQALAEFEIENWRDYAARSAAARKAKLPDAAPAARP